MIQEQRPSDLAFMQHPDFWPAWPVLPLKRSQRMGWPEMGCLFEGSFGVVPTVHLCTMYDLNKPHERKEYSDLAAIVADGWIVD